MKGTSKGSYKRWASKSTRHIFPPPPSIKMKLIKGYVTSCSNLRAWGTYFYHKYI